MEILVAMLVSVVTLLALLTIFVLLPPDHFLHTRPTRSVARRVITNALGVVLVLGGVALLVLPGPGIVAIVLGISLTDFPGKRWLERRVLCRPRVLAPINGLRRRVGRRPLLAPCDGVETDRTDSGAPEVERARVAAHPAS
jgi:hypothetical protein